MSEYPLLTDKVPLLAPYCDCPADSVIKRSCAELEGTLHAYTFGCDTPNCQMWRQEDPIPHLTRLAISTGLTKRPNLLLRIHTDYLKACGWAQPKD